MSRADHQWHNAMHCSPRTGHNRGLQLVLDGPLCMLDMQGGHGPQGWLGWGMVRINTCSVHVHPMLDHVPGSLIFAALWGRPLRIMDTGVCSGDVLAKVQPTVPPGSFPAQGAGKDAHPPRRKPETR